jgi:putative ABC transport system permease protein
MTRLYRAALRVLPSDVRDRHGAQMVAVYADLLRDARIRRGWRGVIALTLAEVAALAVFAWREHRGLPRPPRIDERVLIWPAEPEGRPLMLASLAQDLRYAARMLRRTPGFTFVCVVTMALAIGANSAIFTAINGVLVKALPYHDADRIMVLGHVSDGFDGLGSTTPGNFYDWQARATAFESMAAFAYTARILTWNGSVDRVIGTQATGRLFHVLGRSATEGRVFTDADDLPGSPATIVLSQPLARRLFGDARVVNRTIGVGGMPFTVIGVMPADFTFPDYDAEFWLPARFDAKFRENRDQYFLEAVARLKPGVTLEQARAQLNTVMDAIRRDFPQYTERARGGVVPMKDLLVDNVRTRLLTLMGAVVFILLIACANLGNLLMARASSRRREIAVRYALGARPGRLVRQMLTESVMLAVIGGAAGLALGYAMLGKLVTWLPQDLPRANEISLDPFVVALTVVVSIACGLAFGLFPALQLASRVPMQDVREGTRGSRHSGRIRTVLVAAEVALALVLLTGAGLLVRSFNNLTHVDPGFRATRLLTLRVGVSGAVYKTSQQRVAFFDELRSRIERLPGVEAAAMTSYFPVTGYGTGAWFNILDKPVPPNRTPPSVAYRVVSANLFQTLGIPLIRGRFLTDADRAEGARAVVISEAVAKRFWPNEDPIGKRIYLGAPDNRLFQDAEIVGIVGDVAQLSLDSGGGETVYGTHHLMPFWSNFTFAVRTAGDPAALTSAIRAQLRELDPTVPLYGVKTIDEVLAQSRAPARSSMLLVGLFAVLAVTLAVIGVFGVLSYSVTQRTTELGIRMALGATARSVKLLVLGQGMAPVAAGVVAGIGGALALTRFLQTLLFNVKPTDPITFVSVSVLLAAIAAIASYIPARRATKVDPVTVLRQE